jgi:DNA-binding transcriptional LysR family regulator
MSRTVSENRVSRRLRFRDLQVFFSVVQCGSMAKAAHELGVTQPAVSEVVAGLEDAFGARLFDRSPHGVEPTVYGRALLKRGVAAFDEIRQGIRDIEFLVDPTKGEVRIGCVDSLAGGLLAPFVQKFCHRYPGVVITIEPVQLPTLELPELHARKVDVVLSRLQKPHADDPVGDGLDVEILFEDEAVVAAGADSRWARRRKITLADLRDASWVGTSQDTLTRTLLDRAYRSANLPPPTMRVTTYSVQLRAHLLATGDFLTAMPKSMLKLNAECRGLRQLPVRLPGPRFPVAIITLKGRTVTPAVGLFLDMLREYVRESGLAILTLGASSSRSPTKA